MDQLTCWEVQSTETLFKAMIGTSGFVNPPSASVKRLEEARILTHRICKMLQSSLSRPSFRSAWTLIDKVLNRALDYDARILHPLIFGPLADELDRLVYQCLLEILQFSDQVC